MDRNRNQNPHKKKHSHSNDLYRFKKLEKLVQTSIVCVFCVKENIHPDEDIDDPKPINE